MAGPGSNQYNNTDSLFVSPDTLVLDHDLNALRPEHARHQSTSTYGLPHPATHHQTVWASQTQQQKTSLPLHTSTDWTSASLRAQLPPTPLSPFRPLRPLSEDERLAFPCTGSAAECWNTELCPKHRDAIKQQHQSTTPPDFAHHRHFVPNPRRRSAPASDVELPPAKMMKRNATTPEEADPNIYHRPAHVTIGRESRPPLSRGRVPHNLVERRYRDNLNNQIESLRMVLPSLKDAVASTTDLDDSSCPRMPSKAVIISTAATYIRDMENERTRLNAANKALQEQVLSLQKLIRCDDCNVLQYLNAMQVSAAHLPTPS